MLMQASGNFLTTFEWGWTYGTNVSMTVLAFQICNMEVHMRGKNTVHPREAWNFFYAWWKIFKPYENATCLAGDHNSEPSATTLLKSKEMQVWGRG